MDCRTLHIAIIGAGASGTLTAIQLLHKLNVPANIFLIEKRREAVYRGAAYSSQLCYEPLNVIAGRMSIFNNLPDDFYNWLLENKQAEADEEITRESYVSRRWFGDYLTERIGRAAVLSEWATLKPVEAEVLDIAFNYETDCYQLTLIGDETIWADYLVFATGNESPADVLDKTSIAKIGEKYISNPWFCNALARVKSSDDVLIVGTGLTMIDHVVSLYNKDHQGKIYALSRNGYLPQPHAKIQNVSFDIQEEPADIFEAVRLVKTKIAEAGEQGICWQNSLDALRPYTSRFWKSMDPESKKYFLNRLKTYWEIHRHRMPVNSAKAINELIENDRLTILAGNVQSAKLLENRVELNYQPKSSAEITLVTVDVVINCTGPTGNYYKCENGLIKSLLEKGWMKQDELQLGIKTGIRGDILKCNGVVLHNAFAVGPLRKAAEWESTAMREIRTQAENVAIAIALPAEKSFDMAIETGL